MVKDIFISISRYEFLAAPRGDETSSAGRSESGQTIHLDGHTEAINRADCATDPHGTRSNCILGILHEQSCVTDADHTISL